MQAPVKMFIRICWLLSLVLSLEGSAIHWSIDWMRDMNLLSGSYVSKELTLRLIKLDNILKTKINALDSEIDPNFLI